MRSLEVGVSRKATKKPKGVIKIKLIEDWFIYGVDESGQWWYLNTELWNEWSSFYEGIDQEPNAVAEYMLPFALKGTGEEGRYDPRWVDCVNPHSYQY